MAEAKIKTVKPKTVNLKPTISVEEVVAVGKKVAKKPVKTQENLASLIVPMYSLDGKKSGSLKLPQEVFGAKINKPLLSQALRVYLNNTKGHFSNTLTRGEVHGTTHKLYRQKGTGGARHGSRKAPIFIKGGIALGPKYRKLTMELPKKMKQAALISSFAQKALEGEVIGISGLDKILGKTSQIAGFLKVLNKRNVLLVTDAKNAMASRAVGNITKTDILVVGQLNALDVIKHQTLAFTKEAVQKLEKTIAGNTINQGKAR